MPATPEPARHDAQKDPGTGAVPASAETKPTDGPIDFAPVEFNAPNLAQVKTLLKRLGPVGPLTLIAASMPGIGGFALLGSLKWSGPWLQAHGAAGVVAYIVAFAVLAGLALLPTYAQAVLAGFAFGLYIGTGAAMCGIAGAALIGYLIARRASGNRVVRLIEEQPKWRAVYDALLGSSPAKAMLIVTLLRVPPNSPFAITNLILAACRVRPLTYLIATVVGIAPRTAAAVFIGATAQDLDFSQSRQRWFFVAGIVALLIVIAVIGTMANHAIAKVTRTPSLQLTQPPNTAGPSSDYQGPPTPSRI